MLAAATSSRRLPLLRRAGVAAAAASTNAGVVPYNPFGLAPAPAPAVSATTIRAPTTGGGVRGLASQPARAPPFHRPPQVVRTCVNVFCCCGLGWAVLG